MTPTFVLLACYFGFCGLAYGGQGVLLAEIMRALGLSIGGYGSAELAPPLVGFALLVGGAGLTVAIGKRAVAMAGLVLFALAALLLAAASGFWSFAFSLVVLGGGYGAVEMAMNSAAMDWEQASGRQAMNLLHAVFSGGAIAGAGISGLLLERGVAYAGILWGFGCVCGLLLLITLMISFPPCGAVSEGGGGIRLLARADLQVLATIGMLGVVGESVANCWSVIHLRSLGATALAGGASYALFNAGMLLGRLMNTVMVARQGARVSLRVSGAVVTMGGALLMTQGNLGLAVAGFALTGLGVAGIIPTVLSSAAERMPGRAAEVTGAVMGAIYLAFALCGPVVGWMAEWLSLNAAIAVVCASGMAIPMLARKMRI